MKRSHLILLLSVLGTGFVVAGTSWFLWRPLVHDLERLRQQQQTSARDTQLARSRTQALQSLSAHQDVLKERVDTLSGRFMEKDQPLPLIQQLETVAKETKTALSLSFPEQETTVALQPRVSSSPTAGQSETPTPVLDPLAGLKTTSVEAKLTGDFQQLTAAIAAIEHLAFLGEIRSLAFSQPAVLPGAEPGSLQPAATLTIRFFLAP